MSWIENENQYLTLRTQLLKQQTTSQQQLLFRVSTIIDKDQNEQAKDQTIQDKIHNEEKSNKRLILHYRHEQRLASYKKDLHQIWNNTFNATSILDTRLIVGTRNNRNTAEELVSKRPSMPSTAKNKNQ